MTYTANELTQLRTQLAEAESAYHRLMLGEQVVRVQDQSGESITYNNANASRLKAYIETLRLQISTAAPINKGPIRPMFL